MPEEHDEANPEREEDRCPPWREREAEHDRCPPWRPRCPPWIMDRLCPPWDPPRCAPWVFSGYRLLDLAIRVVVGVAIAVAATLVVIKLFERFGWIDIPFI